ncbi:ABC-2 type transporter protein [Chondrocystis sp. NIES-4102]|nr:ABC-2 type transporter protein [Chondrocystis sp. NIES-4102]
MKRILAQCLKELNQFRRDRLTVALALILPLGMLLIYGYAIRLETKNIPLSVQDLDNSYLSRSYVERLYATNQFIPARTLNSSPEIVIDRSIAKAVIVIPPDFSRKIKSNKVVDVQVLIDGTDVNNARVIQNSIRATTNFFLETNNLQPNTQLVTSKTRLWFNPGRKESLYIVPGIYGVIFWVFPSMLTAIALVREKEQGTIIQVYASDLSAREWLLGKGLAYLLVALTEALVVMGISVILFQLRLQGEPIPLIIGTLIYLATSVSFGLLVGTRASNQTGAVQGTAIAGFLTAFLLSGFIYRLENIPFPLSLISQIIPARYYILITRDAFIRGTGWAGVWYVPLIVGLIGLIIFTAATRNLKRMQLND